MADRPAIPVPAGMEKRLRDLLGGEADELFSALDDVPPTSIRLHPEKKNEHRGTPVPWCQLGRYLKERPQFTLDPAYHAGAYYVQDASSMLIEHAIRTIGADTRTIDVLDLCAAPGGKSTLIRAILQPASTITCNEPDPHRRAILQENLWKWGIPGCAVIGADPKALQQWKERFHVVLVDAPCSGEGLMRKDMFARKQWSEKLVERCAREQHRILEHAWELVKPGGHLIYSTCTWEVEENEHQLERLIEKAEAHEVVLPTLVEHGVVAGRVGIRCYPHQVQGEGFYLGVLQKKDGAKANTVAAEWNCVDVEGTHFLVNDHQLELLRMLNDDRALRNPGIALFTMRKGTMIPHAAAAFSPTALKHLDKHFSYSTVALDLEAALRFLKGEALAANKATGWCLFTHKGLGLGWGKGAGERWNNHFPKAWRIRMHV